MSLDAPVSLVVGGTKGIGRAVSLHLAERGPVFANYLRDSDAAGALVAEAAGLGLSVETAAADVSSKAGVNELVDQVLKAAGRLDVVVFSAVDPYLTSALKVDEERFWRALRTNTAPFLWLGQRLAEVADGPARLIGLTSPFSHRYVEGYSAIGPSKAALESLVVYLGAELAHSQITVNAVSGGLIDTPLLRANVPEAHLAAWVRRTPISRLGRPDDVAALVGWLAGPASEWITGQVVTLDGGYFLR